MGKFAITLHDHEYTVTCDPGEESRLQEIVRYVNNKMRDIEAKSENTAISETRLFMLTCLLLADELAETKRAHDVQRGADEDLMVAAVEHLRHRVAHIANQVGRV